MSPRLVVLLGTGAVLLVVVATVPLALGRQSGSDPARYVGSEVPPGIELVDFALTDQAGRLVRSPDLRGRVLLLTFLDSQCTESCPVIAWTIARTLDGLEDSERRQVRAVAISTDPEEDTRGAVRAFLARNRALGRLEYLGASEPVATLRLVWRAFDVLSSLESGQDTLHSAPVRVYDRRGIWVSTLHAGADLTEENLATDIRAALTG